MDIPLTNIRSTPFCRGRVVAPGACTRGVRRERAHTRGARSDAAGGASSTSSDTAPTGTSTLDGHLWHLSAATNAAGERIDALFPTADGPLTLQFKDGQVGVSSGCNRIGGDYRIDDQGQLQVGDLASTRMACDTALMQADKAISALLAHPLSSRIEETTPPQLKLDAVDGSSSTWVGEATAETRYGSAGETVFLEVAPQRVACSHPMMPNYQCLQVREVRYDDNGIKQLPPGEWQPLYEDIEGFDFVAGDRKVLRLKKFKRDPVPADASSIAYVLDMVVESEIAPVK